MRLIPPNVPATDACRGTESRVPESRIVVSRRIEITVEREWVEMTIAGEPRAVPGTVEGLSGSEAAEAPLKPVSGREKA